MCISFCTLSTAAMALPSAAFGARLNDTVIAGNWPWWVITRGSVVFSKCEKAPSGTALLMAEVEGLRSSPPCSERSRARSQEERG